jgi:hypothetical protein
MDKLTRATEFNHIPAVDGNLMMVRPGLDNLYAESQAECLEGAVRELLIKAVEDDGMRPDIAWLCRFSLDAAAALRLAAYQHA